MSYHKTKEERRDGQRMESDTVLKAKQRQVHNRQQQILEMFFKEFLSWKADNIGVWIAAVMLEILQGICFCIPYQMVGKSDMELLIGIELFCGVFGTMTYLMPYVRFTEKKGQVNIYKKLKYLPVSLKEIRIFRLKKLVRFCFRLFLIFLAVQLFLVLLCYHQIALGNLWYPFVFGFLLQLLLNGMLVLFLK